MNDGDTGDFMFVHIKPFGWRCSNETTESHSLPTTFSIGMLICCAMLLRVYELSVHLKLIAIKFVCNLFLFSSANCHFVLFFFISVGAHFGIGLHFCLIDAPCIHLSCVSYCVVGSWVINESKSLK